MKLALHWQILIGLVLGAVVGLVLNATVGTRGTAGDPVTVELPNPPRTPEANLRGMTVFDSPNRTEITLLRGGIETNRYIIDGTLKPQARRELTGSGAKVFTSMAEFSKEQPQVHDLFQKHGASWGRYLGETASDLGGLFLRMLKMISIPLIIFSLTSGVLGLGQAERLGTMFGRTATYYVATSMLAICTGLAMSNLVQPGLDTSIGQQVEEITITGGGTGEGKSLGEVLFEQVENLIPENPFQALSDGNFLSIIAFSIAFAIFTLIVGGGPRDFFTKLANDGFEVMMALTSAIIHLAPIGVFFLILYATATQGIGVFYILGEYMMTVLLALVIHACVTLPLIVWFFAKRSPLAFVKAMSPALLTAFSTASSNATLPLTLSNVEERAGISNKVSSFVLPLGATVNMDGTALYEVVAVLFIANISGVELTFAQQVIIAITALLASIGAAGIPHAGLVMMAIILQAVGLPVEQQGLIIAVDRVLDMGRTAVNVWSDSCGCAVVARLEGLDSRDTTSPPDTPSEPATPAAAAPVPPAQDVNVSEAPPSPS
jgi:Na+/H+-dicarboxylate symporter